MADIIQIEGFRTTDPVLGDYVRAGFSMNITQDQMPVDKIIENIFVKIASDLNRTTDPLLVGDITDGTVTVTENDDQATIIVVKWTIDDTDKIDSGFSNQKYILQVDVFWDDNTSDRLLNGFCQFNPGI